MLQQFGIDATQRRDRPADVRVAAAQAVRRRPARPAATPGRATSWSPSPTANGRYLDHLVRNRIGWEFDAVISVETVGAFKPHPGVYRKGAALLGLEVGQCMMVSANSFDVMGARMCGMRGAFVNRYALPYEDTPFQPDLTVPNFTELADALT